jgi:hypothetical protein
MSGAIDLQSTKADTLSQQHLDEILAEIRAGQSVVVGVSRCHVVYSFSGGRWCREDFDEGRTEGSEITESALRSIIASSPGDFRRTLWAPWWRRFGEAFLRNDDVAARGFLEEMRARQAPTEWLRILGAVLAWPETKPEPGLAPLIREEAQSTELRNMMMDMVEWRTSESLGRRGMAVMDCLIEMIGPYPRCWELRADFGHMAGDAVAELADLERELEATPPDAFWYPQIAARASELKRTLSTG